MLRAVSDAVGRVDGGAEVVGVHLEGPFINPTRAGAFRRHWIHAFDPDQFLEYTRVSANTRLQVTLATELLGSTRIMCGSNVILALGHTDATYAEAVDSFERGISHCTHLYNAMRPFHHREPGVLGAAFTTPQVTAEIIADGVHVADGALKTAYVCMGSRRLCLVTDGITLAGVGDGEFDLGDERVRCRNGRATLPDGTLAGSVTTMDECVRRMARIAGTLPEALRMAAGAPAKVWGLSKKGRLLPGYEADVVALREDQTVAMTWVGGQLVWDGRTVEEKLRAE
jgi:N-acetylglucosamine-6-phosphate deacetylase